MPYGVPSRTTFNDVSNRLNPNAFTDWLSPLVNPNKDLVMIDGKIVDGHSVNAWWLEIKRCLG